MFVQSLGLKLAFQTVFAVEGEFLISGILSVIRRDLEKTRVFMGFDSGSCFSMF